MLDDAGDDLAAGAVVMASLTSAAVTPYSAALRIDLNTTAGPLTTMPLKTSTTPLTFLIDTPSLRRAARAPHPR
jgi:hypothetical protein